MGLIGLMRRFVSLSPRPLVSLSLRLSVSCSPVHKLDRQPIEQFRMCGRLAQLAEVARRAHDAFAEMMLPDAIDHHPRGERILPRHQPLGQSAPPVARFGVRRWGGKIVISLIDYRE